MADNFTKIVDEYHAAIKSGDSERAAKAREALAEALQALGQPRRPDPFLGNTVVDINVPSGKLIMSDDLRAVEKYRVEMRESINYGRGCDLYARDHAEQVNVAYASVGNTCPTITVNADGVIKFVNPDYDDTDSAILEEGETNVGWICTDLWAVMAVDYQQWLDDGGKPVDEANAEYAVQSFTVLDVEPGKYRWTVYSHSDNFDRDADGRVLFAELEKI